ncbi:MAG: trypsin-like peptidase domain-containing protein [Actinobacteria bacterium]|nr:trypsin-like peptidase domain-containing protein [Actinomycetota bacterium]
MSGGTPRVISIVAALAAATVLGAVAGAGTFAVLDEDASPETRDVTVESSEPAAATETFANVYARAYKSVVEITATGAGSTQFGGQEQQAQGSGFVYSSNGTIVTNQHVVDGASSVSIRFWNGTTRRAEILGTDPSTDLAVLDIDAPASLLLPLALGSSSALQIGDTVAAIGSPFGLEGTLTTGVVSALHRQMTAPNNFTITDSIQTDAAINHGNSGGPLLDARGRVVGVNAQIESDSGGNDGIGFAIPSNTVRSIVAQLLDSGTVAHAYLGITMVAVEDGLAVTEVRSGTPAEDAALRAATGTTTMDGAEVPSGGDVIVAIDGDRVTTSGELQSAIDAKRPGEKVRLTVLRDGERRSVTVTLGTRPS